jgi:flagellar basal-body rod protein FlgC
MFKAIDFNKVLNDRLMATTGDKGYSDPLEEGQLNKMVNPPIMSVIVDKIMRDDKEPLMKFEPGHPDANAEGYVAYPNINPVIEMADLIEATRSYQANVAAFQSVKTMAQSAMSIIQA